MATTLKIFFLFLGDILALYAALFATLILRYQERFYNQFIDQHFLPFTIIFVFWLIIFYIAGLYDLKRLGGSVVELFKLLGPALLINSALAIFLFYILPALVITPKTNLLIFVVVFSVVETFWRRWFNRIITSGEALYKVLLVGNGNAAEEIYQFLSKNQQIGYEIKKWLKENDKEVGSSAELEQVALDSKVNLVVIPVHLKKDEGLMKALYNLLEFGVEIQDIPRFYEKVLEKLPLDELEESWFLENISTKNRPYFLIKRVTDVILGLVLLIPALVLWPIISLGVRLSSEGPVLLKQLRVGKNQKTFTHYKFRSMRENQNHGWLDEDKKRITPFGKMLRRAHLDELPQVWNLLRGDISLVGPRPDFLEFFKKLEQEIPYYKIRTIVKPGLTGWAQIKLPQTKSLEATRERFAYDLYYLKNRSLALDLTIILKTAKEVFTASGA